MTTYTWIGAASGGLWNVAGNWSPPGVPTSSGDEAFIPNSGTTITISGGTYSVGVLQMAAGTTLALTNGASLTLYPPGDFSDLTTLSGTITVDATSTLAFAQGWTTAQLGSIQAASGATLWFQGSLDNTGATLSVGAGVVLRGAINAGTIEGAINLAASASLTLEGGPTLTGAGGSGAGVINDTANGSTLRLQDTEALANTTINIGDATNTDTLTQYDSDGSGHVVTLGSDVTVNVSYFANFAGSSYTGDALVNQGKINDTGASGYLQISTPTFTNAGTINVANGDTLLFINNSALTNTGTINVDGTSTIQFQGLTTAQLGTLNASSGATVNFAGTGLNNTGAVFTPVSGVNYEGEIVGGTIDGALTVNFGQTLTLGGGPIVTTTFGTGAGFINDANAGGTLAFDGTQTLDNFALLLGNTYVTVLKANTTTTLGPNVTTTILGNTIFDGAANAGLVNQGVIDDNYNQFDPAMYSIAFTNEGKMNFTDHEGFVVDNSVTFTNAANGQINVSAGANGGTYILFQDSIVNNGTITVNGVSLGQQSYVDYYYAVTGSGTTDITGGGLADFFQSMTQTTTFTGAGRLQLNSNVNSGTVSGFGAGDSIDLTALHWGGTTNSWSLDPSTNKLTVTEGGVSSVIQLDPTGNFAGYVFTLADDHSGLPGGDGTLVTVVPCFGRGTLIATDRGEITVEDLAPGDLVETASGGLRPVRWIGHRSLDIANHPSPRDVHPVRVRKDSFGDGLPRRDLWLSPGHNIAFEDVLIPARALVNGISVQQVEQRHVEYWHVELDAHDVILAEGLAAESYLDTGNRTGFDNGGVFVEAHPDFRPKHWAATCLPLVEQGPQVERARAALRERLLAQGYALSREADACLQADGERVAPMRLSPTRLAFLAPDGARSLTIVSNVFVPFHTMEGRRDRRELGLCIKRVQIDGATLPLERIEAGGWCEAERERGVFTHRWTSGAAELPTGARLIVIDLAGQGLYWREPGAGAAALSA